MSAKFSKNNNIVTAVIKVNRINKINSINKKTRINKINHPKSNFIPQNSSVTHNFWYTFFKNKNLKKISKSKMEIL